MDDSLFARLGYDPVRIHTALCGGPPPPGGVVRLSPRATPADTDAETSSPGTEPDPPPPGKADQPRESGEGGGASAASPDTAPEPAPPEPPPEDDLAYDPGDPASDMHAWLVHNWQAIEALEAAGRLPELAPPASDPAPEAVGGQVPALPPPPRPPVRERKGDRWTKPKMAEFLRQLAATHSVSAAARAVGMHRRSAYKLRARLKGQPFDIAWEAAFRHGYDNLAHAALERALNGVEVPHYHQGELVGTHRKYDERLTVALLAMRNRAGAPMLGRYGAAAEWWGDRWDALLERVETGAVDWSDEAAALGEAGLARLGVPDTAAEAERIIARNLPDDLPARRR